MPGNGWRVVPGTWVRLRHSTRALGKWGRVLKVEGNGCFIVETDSCKELLCARSDIRVSQSRAAPHDWFPMRKTLPYGQYVCADGSKVLFNRDYEPLIKIMADGTRSACDPKEQIIFDRQEWFYWADTHKPAPWQSADTLDDCISRLTSYPE